MMMSLKTWCLLSLSAFLFLSITPTETKVVQSIQECEGFLLEDVPPKIPGILENGVILNRDRYKAICQTYRDQKRFVTLYDTENKIPVFSAYKFTGAKTGKRSSWMIEPELEGSNMNVQGYFQQAVDNDYKNDKDLTKGHLFPASYTADESDKESTFTLTNIVPQYKSFNEGSWRKMEKCVRCILEKYCRNNNLIEGYVVTGAKPGSETLGKKKINIPSVLWSAFCCETHKDNKWLASAHWGDNTQENANKYMQTKTLEELEQELNIDVFSGTKCPRNENVMELYADIDDTCQCPPQASPAPPTTTTPSLTHHDLLMRLYQRRHLICRKARRRRVNQPRSQFLKLRQLCLNLIRGRLRSDESKEFLLELLNHGDLYHGEDY